MATLIGKKTAMFNERASIYKMNLTKLRKKNGFKIL